MSDFPLQSNYADVNELATTLETRQLELLEQGEILFVPFDTTTFADLQAAPVEVLYDPLTKRWANNCTLADSWLSRFEEITTACESWLRSYVPKYAREITIDSVAFRAEEEATRTRRFAERDDLLHIDLGGLRPSSGQRVLKLCLNLHETDPRVWALSESWPELLARYASNTKIPNRTREEWTANPQGFLRLFTGDWSPRRPFDTFALRLLNFLKENNHFQARAVRKVQIFPAGSAWLSFTDARSYAQLRGQAALEVTALVSHSVLTLPELSPLAQLEKFGQPSEKRLAG